MDTKGAVAYRIKQLCIQNDITINALANKAGVPPMNIYSIVNKKSKNPGIVNIKKICDALNISLGDFFGSRVFDSLEQEIE